jgi:hypothetical protein
LGQKVLSINGIDPLSYLESQSVITGGYTQASTKINEVVAGYALDNAGNYRLRPGKLVNRAWPTEDSVTINFESSGTLTIPVLAAPKNGRWTDLNGYLQQQCVLANATTSGNSTTASRFRRRDDIVDDNEDVDGTMNLAATGLSTSGDIFQIGEPISTGAGISIYKLTGNYSNVGVMYIGSFDGDETFVTALNTGLDAMNSSGVNRLIIDVSGNGGGSVALGQYLEQTLFPDKYPGFPTEARAPDLAVQCAVNLANGPAPENNMYDYRQYCKVKHFQYCI